MFESVLRRHPELVAVLAHSGMPEWERALELVARFDNVHLDTTMVGVPFHGAQHALPADWPARLVGVTDRIVLGTFPNIPHPYATQLAAIEGWAEADERLGEPFLRAVLYENPARLLRVDSRT